MFSVGAVVISVVVISQVVRAVGEVVRSIQDQTATRSGGLLVFIIILREDSTKKNSKSGLFQKGGGGRPQSPHFVFRFLKKGFFKRSPIILKRLQWVSLTQGWLILGSK